ncbi:MAG: hypothetical protein AAF429_06455 [Pseudomonadota bacterium]
MRRSEHFFGNSAVTSSAFADDIEAAASFYDIQFGFDFYGACSDETPIEISTLNKWRKDFWGKGY